jgi:hypothetical protein
MKRVVFVARLFEVTVSALAVILFVGMILYLCALAIIWGDAGDRFYGFVLLAMFGLCVSYLVSDIARNFDDSDSTPPAPAGGEKEGE